MLLRTVGVSLGSIRLCVSIPALATSSFAWLCLPPPSATFGGAVGGEGVTSHKISPEAQSSAEARKDGCTPRPELNSVRASEPLQQLQPLSCRDIATAPSCRSPLALSTAEPCPAARRQATLNLWLCSSSEGVWGSADLRNSCR
jgi:hypothetical protein